MAVRFIIGRAGSGKTHHCLTAIRDRLRVDPIHGPRLILLVPEQVSLQMDRAILEDTGRGSHRAEVLSFQRLAFRVLESTGGTARRAISEPARAMVLRHLAGQLAPRLRYYRRVERLGGFPQQMGRTVAELIQEAVAPDDLAPIIEAAEAVDALQAAKLHDVRLIYAAYLAYLGPERLDPSQYLEAARAVMPRCGWLDGAEVWVDGFASLSGQEMLTLIEVARRAAFVEMALLDDPRPATAGAEDAAALFSKTHRTWKQLHRRFIESGIAIDEPLRRAPQTPPRFAKNEALARIERHLFTSAPVAADAAPAEPPAGVELVELPTRRVEVEYAVAQLHRWVADPGWRCRFRDVAVIVRDLEPYHDLLTNALTARGIPFFIDRRRPIGHHPLIELLRAAVALADDDMSLEAVRLTLKTGLVFSSSVPEAADELENYLIAHGIEGSARWRGRDWTFGALDIGAGGPRVKADPRAAARTAQQLAQRERVNATRRRFLDLFDPWLTAAWASPPPTGAQWAAAFLQLFERLDAGRTLAEWTRTSEDDGDLDQAEEHRQVWRDTTAFLDDVAFAFAEIPLSPRDMALVLEAGLAQLTLGLAPPMLDQVLVGSIERSRHPELRAAVVLGFNDGLFPSIAKEDAILTDDDRVMMDQRGLSIGPPARQRTLDESMLTYIAATRPSEALVITCAAADERGRELRPSPHIAALRAACPGLALRQVGDPARLRDSWDVLTAADAVIRLASEFRDRPEREKDEVSVRARWNGLYLALRDEPAMRRAMGGFAPVGDAKLSPPMVQALAGDALRTSVSRLEEFATCPFKHFAVHLLGLEERAEAALQPVDVGKVHHAILEDFIVRLTEGRRDLGPMSDDDLLRELEESSAQVARGLPAEGLLSQAREAYILRRAQAKLARVLRAQRSVSAAGATKPAGAEVPFGLGTGGLPALELTTPKGRKVALRGVIDRVDLAELADETLGVVVDYKLTKNKRLKVDQVYHGLSLQLVAYLLVLERGGFTTSGRPIRPIGAFYVSLTPRYIAVDHPAEELPVKQAVLGAHGPRGLLDAEHIGVLDATLDKGHSPFYSFYRNKEGGMGHADSGDGADAPTFRAVLDHVRRRLGELADGVLDGDVSVKPYRLGNFSPCSWCPMSSVCRFEMGINDVRYLESLKRSEVFKRIANSE